MILIEPGENGLPVTVYTCGQYCEGIRRQNIAAGCFDLAVLTEGGAAMIICFLLRRKSDKL